MTKQSLADLGSAAAGIAHDLNNQLTLIVNYLEVSNLEGARVAAGRCTALTSSLLLWCRGETIRMEPIDLGKFLFDFADNVETPDYVPVELELAEGLPEIKADPVALTRVLTNLVDNACDAMKGKGLVTITAFERTIEIGDSGPGIAPENLKRIFEPFFSTKNAKGTGLGLSIVREIMRQHGGSVWVRSKPGHGATFCLKFR
jgi:two-component system, NtrC family, sensor kinase